MTKILVVEDEVIIANQMEQYLASEQYNIIGSAVSGEEAIDMAREHKPDVVLMDIVMPGGKVDGVSAAEIIRDELDCVVIFITAYTGEPTLERAKKTEPFGYIVKPFHEKEIHATIEMALYKKDMDDRLKKSEESFRMLFECTSDGIIGLDSHNGNILHANPSFCRMFGYTKGEIHDAGIDELTDSAHREELWQFFRQVLLQGTVNLHAFPCKKSDNSVLYADITLCKPILKGIDSITAFFRDVTGRIQVEEAMRNAEAYVDRKNRLHAYELRKINEWLFHELSECKNRENRLLDRISLLKEELGRKRSVNAG